MLSRRPEFSLTDLARGGATRQRSRHTGDGAKVAGGHCTRNTIQQHLRWWQWWRGRGSREQGDTRVRQTSAGLPGLCAYACALNSRPQQSAASPCADLTLGVLPPNAATRHIPQQPGVVRHRTAPRAPTRCARSLGAAPQRMASLTSSNHHACMHLVARAAPPRARALPANKHLSCKALPSRPLCSLPLRCHARSNRGLSPPPQQGHHNKAIPGPS